MRDGRVGLPGREPVRDRARIEAVQCELQFCTVAGHVDPAALECGGAFQRAKLFGDSKLRKVAKLRGFAVAQIRSVAIFDMGHAKPVIDSPQQYFPERKLRCEIRNKGLERRIRYC